MGVDPEIYACGARMIVDDAITEGEKITETMARLGRRFASVHRPSQEAQSTSELDYVYDV